MIKVTLDEGAYMPEKAHKTDAGFDLKVPRNIPHSDLTVPARGSLIIDTGVHIAIPEGYVGMITSKSGLCFKHSLLTTGTIDTGYTGSIKVKIYNASDVEYQFWKGDKIAQLVIKAIHPDNKLVHVTTLEETERGDGGFGSTGK